MAQPPHIRAGSPPRSRAPIPRCNWGVHLGDVSLSVSVEERLDACSPALFLPPERIERLHLPVSLAGRMRASNWILAQEMSEKVIRITYRDDHKIMGVVVQAPLPFHGNPADHMLRKVMSQDGRSPDLGGALLNSQQTVP